MGTIHEWPDAECDGARQWFAALNYAGTAPCPMPGFVEARYNAIAQVEASMRAVNLWLGGSIQRSTTFAFRELTIGSETWTHVRLAWAKSSRGLHGHFARRAVLEGQLMAVTLTVPEALAKPGELFVALEGISL